MSARKIALLLNVHHSKIDDILNKAKSTMRREIENQTKIPPKMKN
jgi:IS30 family transposase